MLRVLFFCGIIILTTRIALGRKEEGTFFVNKLKHKIDKDFTVVSNIVFKDSRLSLKAKGLFCQIASLPENWDFTVGGLAQLANDGRESIQAGLNELKELGYLTWKQSTKKGRFNGNLVETHYPKNIPLSEKPFTGNPLSEIPLSENRHNKELIDKVLNNKECIDNSTKVELAKPEELVTHGKSEINEMFEAWNEIVGYEISANKQKNRYACNNLLKKYGKEKLTQLLNGVLLAQSDKFAPRISDFATLQSKLNELLLWGKRKGTNQTKGVIRI